MLDTCVKKLHLRFITCNNVFIINYTLSKSFFWRLLILHF
uniref:Uncharacterized protein n=1 Tax=Anguilla anguilla TaxID=7936 RepID=A0A0E9SIN5_ANGAN